MSKLGTVRAYPSRRRLDRRRCGNFRSGRMPPVEAKPAFLPNLRLRGGDPRGPLNVGFARWMTGDEIPLRAESRGSRSAVGSLHPVLFHLSRQLRDRRHQWRWPKMLCAISRPIPQPNPCATDRMSPEPCWGSKTAIAPTARPARMKSLMKVLRELEVGRTGPRGRRDRETRRRNMFAAPSHAEAAARSPRTPR